MSQSTGDLADVATIRLSVCNWSSSALCSVVSGDCTSLRSLESYVQYMYPGLFIPSPRHPLPDRLAFRTGRLS